MERTGRGHAKSTRRTGSRGELYAPHRARTTDLWTGPSASTGRTDPHPRPAPLRDGVPVLLIPRVLAVLAGSAALVLPPVGSVAAASTWVLPLAGAAEVTRPFDPPSDPYGTGHRGVDLAGRPGQPVLAAGEGTVTFAAPLAGRGVLTVSHAGGLRTTYEPVSATVTVGALLHPGDRIGTLDAGHAGCPAAACLHWGLRAGEVYLDPMSLLGGPVRLLPTDGPATSGAGRAADDTREDIAGVGPFGGDDGPGRVTTGAGVLAIAVAGAALATRPRSPPGGHPP